MSLQLSQGTALTPPGNRTTELIVMSVTSHYNNSTRILELLLSANAPLYGTDGRMSTLQMAWLTPTNTTKEAVVITRVSKA